MSAGSSLKGRRETIDFEIDSVRNGEDIFWIQLHLDSAHESLVFLRKYSIGEAFSDLANSVVMRHTASLLDDFIACSPFNLVVDFQRLFDSRVVESKVNINSGSSLIKLSDTERDENTVLNSVVLAQIMNTFGDVL